MLKALKWSLLFLGASAALMAAVLGAAHLYLATDRGAARLLGVINTLYPGEITGRSLEVSLLRQEVIVTDAVLNGPDGRRVLSAERVFLRMDLPALAGLDLVFEVIDATRPDFVMEIDEDGWLNIEAAFVEKTPGEGPLNVYIRNLTCTDGTFEYRAGSGDPVVRLENFDLLMDSAFEHDTLMHFSVPRALASLYIGDTRVDLGQASASCTIFNDRVTDIRAAAALGATGATLTGFITDMADKAQFSLDLALAGDLADLRDMLGLGRGSTGPLRCTITARGDYDDPDFTFEMAYGGGTIEGLAVGAANLAGSVSDRIARIVNLSGGFASGTFTIGGAVDMQRIFPHGYFEGIREEEVVAYDLTATGTSLLLEDIPGLPEGLRGRISPRVALKGSGLSGESLRVESSFSARGSGVSFPPVLDGESLDLQGSLSFQRDVLDIPRLRLRTATASASSAGRIDLSTGAVNADLTLEAPQVRPLLARAGVQGSGDLAATLRISNTWERPVIAVDARALGVVVEDVRLGTIDLSALLDEGGRLTVLSCSLASGSSLVTAQGDVQVFGRFPEPERDPVVDLEIVLTGVNPSDFMENVPLSGVLGGTLSVSGTPGDLSADISLDGRDLFLDDIRLGRATLAGSLARGVLSVSSLELENNRSILRAEGDIALFEPGEARLSQDPILHLAVHGDGLLLEDFTDLARGSATVSADLAGTVRRPSGTARLAASDIDLGFQRFESLEVRASSDGDIVWIEPAVLTVAGDENINARATITLGGAYEFSLGTPGISVGNIGLIQRHNSARGTLFVNAAGAGHLSNPVLAGRLSAAEVQFMDTPLDDMAFSFDLKDRVFTVSGDWNFRLNARHDLATGDVLAEALFAETELTPFFTLAGRKGVSGRLTGRADLAGNVNTLTDVDITAGISSLDIFHEGREIVQARDASLSYRHGYLTLPLTRIVLAQRGLLDIQAEGEVKKTLTLDADGVIPMEVLGLLAEDLSDGTGLIRVTSQVRTTGLKPDISALLTLEDLGWTIPANGQRLHGITGTVTLRNNRIVAEDINGRLDTGTFQLGGAAVLSGFTPQTVELLAQAKALPVVLPDMMDLTLDAEASLDLTGSVSRLWADAVILDGVYYRDVNVNLFTGVLERIITRQQRERQRKQAVVLPWPALASTVLDVSIKRRGDVRVENNIAELDLNPDLKITGTLGNPVLNGRIAVTDGVVTFQNNDFTVSRGVIDFLDPFRTTASVDIRARTQVRDWDITLALEGGLDNLQLTLSSVPAEEPADILSLLVVGKTSRELTQEQSGVAISPSGMIAELLATTYGGEIKRATTLDILELKASDFATSEGGESMTLTVGKELSRRMTVKYVMETRNTETVQRAIAEYKILENLLVNGYQGSDGIFGADMLYRYEFR